MTVPSWGRITESAAGTHLLRLPRDEKATLHYWREGVNEVDFVSEMGTRLCAFEIKSGHETGIQKGIDVFGKVCPLSIKYHLGKESTPSWEDALRWKISERFINPHPSPML